MSEGHPIQAMEIKSRVQERQAWGLATTCRQTAAPDQCWPALIRDLSTSGVGLVLDAYLAADSELAIDIPNSAALYVRVVHATALPGGQWLLGCGLVKPMTAEEVQQLLARAATEN